MKYSDPGWFPKPIKYYQLKELDSYKADQFIKSSILLPPNRKKTFSCKAKYIGLNSLHKNPG